jgi:hypothetical protein
MQNAIFKNKQTDIPCQLILGFFYRSYYLKVIKTILIYLPISPNFAILLECFKTKRLKCQLLFIVPKMIRAKSFHSKIIFGTGCPEMVRLFEMDQFSKHFIHRFFIIIRSKGIKTLGSERQSSKHL